MKPGDRVRYSEVWLRTLTPKRRVRAEQMRGAVVPPKYPGPSLKAEYIRVQWDGAKDGVYYAPQFIEAED